MDASQFIRAHYGWLVSVARQIAGSTLTDAEDLAQEGAIKIWQVFTKNPNQRDYYYLKAAKRRMEDIAYDFYPMLGEENGGKAVNPLRSGVTSLDKELGEDGEDYTLADIVPSPDRVDDSALAYHYHEIYRAIRDLTPFQRNTVFNRFWLDITAWDTDKWQSIKPKLRKSLAHLESAA